MDQQCQKFLKSQNVPLIPHFNHKDEKEHKQPKDPLAPKRPLTAFMQFSRRYRDKILERQPGEFPRSI